MIKYVLRKSDYHATMMVKKVSVFADKAIENLK